LREGGGLDDRATVPLYRVPFKWVAKRRELADPQIDERAQESPGRAGAFKELTMKGNPGIKVP
jgi:hypothetical protein